MAPAAMLVAWVLAVSPLWAQTPRVDISVDIAQGSVRLVLSHSRSVDYSVNVTRGRVEIVYDQAVTVTPDKQRVDDPILKRFEMTGDRTVVFRTGTGYESYEIFELRNPFRLVLDLQGVRRQSPPTRRSERKATGETKIVVLDPGHGGSEFGAVGPSGLQEKEVTLDLARRLRQELQKDGRISVVLTRDEDRHMDLDERTAISNNNRAELFVSIHLNASRRTTASGAETYFMSADATDDDARTVAALENRASEADAGAAPGKANPTGLELVLWDLAQNEYLAESSLLAESVQQHFNTLTGTRDRGVRQAPFRVLMGATSPAILVEVGFISNPEEELKFKGLSYRTQVVDSMAAAIHEYLDNLERLSAPGAFGDPRGGGRE